ncbi:MAG TPA: hypothetical protein VJ251_12305 [Stellaceae bacterium]|nr:hypothetical protein [Stellaceae bacterium]
MTIADLMQQIEETERLIAVYRNANEVIVGTQDEVYSRRGLINRTTLTAPEIGDQIVRSLDQLSVVAFSTNAREMVIVTLAWPSLPNSIRAPTPRSDVERAGEGYPDCLREELASRRGAR